MTKKGSKIFFSVFFSKKNNKEGEAEEGLNDFFLSLASFLLASMKKGFVYEMQ